MLPLNWLDLHTEVQSAACCVADRAMLTSVSATHRVAFLSSATTLINGNHQVVSRQLAA